jgi:hypothetical protein
MRIALLIALVVLPVGCAATDVADNAPLAQQEVAPAEDCSAFLQDRVLLAIDPPVARQGETVRVRAYSPQGPYAPKTIPLSCMRNWTINPAGAGSYSADHSLLTIAADAPVGDILTLGADAPGGFAYLTTALVGRDDVVLTGRWGQIEIDCPNGPAPTEPVRELEFDAMGGFSVTYLPFETYKDFWGKARFDAAGRRMELTIEAGNYRPAGAILSGPAYLDDQGRLVLDGFHLGDRQNVPATPCRYVFAKV